MCIISKLRVIAFSSIIFAVFDNLLSMSIIRFIKQVDNVTSDHFKITTLDLGIWAQFHELHLAICDDVFGHGTGVFDVKLEGYIR